MRTGADSNDSNLYEHMRAHHGHNISSTAGLPTTRARRMRRKCVWDSPRAHRVHFLHATSSPCTAHIYFRRSKSVSSLLQLLILTPGPRGSRMAPQHCESRTSTTSKLFPTEHRAATPPSVKSAGCIVQRLGKAFFVADLVALRSAV
jgi:hypothetical protein